MKPSDIPFDRASIKVVCANQTFDRKQAKTEQSDDKTILRWDSLALSLERRDDGVCSVTIGNEGEETIRLQRVCIEWPAGQFEGRPDTREYVQLYHSRDFSKLSGIRPVHRPNEWSNPADASGMVTVLSARKDGSALLLGALPPYGDCFADFPLLHDKPHRDGAFGVGVHLHSPRSFAPGQEETLAGLIVLGGPDGNALLERYGELIRKRLDGQLRFQPRVTGWNSWDYYAGAIRQNDMIDNAETARRIFGETLRYMVVDEGYECQWGIWDSGWKFPDGLDGLCGAIRQTGYEPGIWTAPLLVNVYTPLYREHPDWFVGDAQGNVFLQNLGYGSMAQLDITHPDAAAFIAETFRRLRAAGFTYFKCDFTQLLLGASSFSGKDMSHAGMLRKLFGIIRDSIGADAYLLACGAPYEAVAGIADAHRTTGDIHNYWSHIRQNIRSMFARWWMQGTLGNMDPDFAIVRCGETTDDPQLNRRFGKQPWKVGANWCSGREMNAEEAKTLLLACLVTGGDLFLGDALGKLNLDGTMWLGRLLEQPAGRGKPVNLFRHDGDDLPIVIADYGGKTLVALFNLSDDYRVQQLPETVRQQAESGDEFWSGEREFFPASGDIPLSPRSVKAWLV
ncbi:glycoside hydrolase family 36 protein [Paenibacillus ginsengarvi]|nr:glycoside hydrolase family 36 protein [Paenibacillus ginsengarvi]